MNYRPLKFFAGLVLVLALALAGVLPVSAAPPSNDDIASATPVTEPLPFTDALDTSEATTAPDDPDCAGNGPTVWYAFTPGQDLQVQANTFGSDYDTTLSVYQGSPGNLSQIACNDDSLGLQSQVLFSASANETYYFMVGAYGSGPGGNLVFTVDQVPPLTVDFRIDPAGAFDRAGNATIRGTMTCSRLAYVDLSGEVKQKVGRIVILGSFYSSLVCDGETPWEVVVSGQNGRFAGGAAEVSVSAAVYDPITGEYNFYPTTTVVRLRKR